MSYQASKKTTGTPRAHRLGLFFTSAEWSAFEQIAKAEGQSVHDWVLKQVLMAGLVAAAARRIAWPTGERT